MTALGLGSPLHSANSPFVCLMAACGADPKVTQAGGKRLGMKWLPQRKEPGLHGVAAAPSLA